MEIKNKCPNCGSEEFVSSLNSYDLLIFKDSKFHVVRSELADIEEEIFCRECGEQVDTETSEEYNKIRLKVSNNHIQ